MMRNLPDLADVRFFKLKGNEYSRSEKNRDDAPQLPPRESTTLFKQFF